MNIFDLLVYGVLSLLNRARSHRDERSRGASTVEWVLICVLAAAIAAVLSAVLIRWVISTANVVRTR